MYQYFRFSGKELSMPRLDISGNLKGLFFYETRQKIFRLLGGKIELEFWPFRQCWAVGPIQI